MEAIFHEKQDGSLCAQHCLNSLLQGQFYSAVDLADLANELDSMERLRMAEMGEDTLEYRQFMQQPSTNMDDSGFFSVQVISRALSVWSLDLVPLQSSNPAAVRARSSAIAANAYICNFREHWFTIRRLGTQWFNLNSLLEGPELVSNTYLGEFLAQLQQEGYDIFLLTGEIPPCVADDILQAAPAVQAEPPRLLSDVPSSGTAAGKAGQNRQPRSAGRDEEADLEAAMMLSLAETSGADGGPANIDSEQLAQVLEMQRQGNWDANTASEDVMMARALRMSEEHHQQQHSGVTEEDEIQAAIALSLEGGGGRSEGNIRVSQEGGGWGSRLRQQEVEEEEKWLQEQKRATEEEEEQLRQALMMSMETEGAAAGSKKEEYDKPKAEVDPVHTAWPMIKNPQPGSLAAGGPTISPAPAKTLAAASTSTFSPKTAPAPTTSRVAGPAIPEGEGHRLGEAGGGRRGPAQPRADDPEEIRRRRMAFLDKLQKSPPSENK